MEDCELDFSELSSEPEFVGRITQFHKSVDKIKNILELVNNSQLYDSLSNSDKLKYNLYMSFSLNSLFWMYLRMEGIDPLNHQIRAENERLRQYMARAKQIHDRNTLMPRVNRDVAQRFVRSSLWESRDARENRRDNNT
ncbi:nuclear nucleic acid-binding protein C1D [Orussus abietinus]|uniref:nuclear nucleic acid-binding protein C1D n=1 Tax=Orussus abietinus TaxID=222816 RepID=UPI0006253B86|nr:nuclear nucleic acid-binding protein C1D [Orussus abietinus]